MLKNEDGFTLLELVVVLIVIGVITSSILPFIRVNLNSYLRVRQGKIAIQQSRIGFNRMINEIKLIDDPSQIDEWDSDHIRFDILVDGVPVTNINYRYSSNYGGLVDRGIGVGWWIFEPPYDPMIVGVKSFNFSYLKADGTSAANKIDIWRIEVEMVLGEEDTPEIVFKTQVHPRNFGF